MGFPRQECWSRLSFASPGDLPNPGIAMQMDSSLLNRQGKPKQVHDSVETTIGEELGISNGLRVDRGRRLLGKHGG